MLAEDNPSCLMPYAPELISPVLGNFSLTHVDSLERAFASLAAGGFDVLLLDLLLEDGQGLDSYLRARAQFPGLPVVALTAQAHEALGIQAIQSGAQDYLVKEHCNPDSLRRAIRAAVERKRIEVALRHSEERFRALIENSSDAIALTDAEGNVLYLSPSSHRIEGYTPEELVGRNAAEHTHPDDLSALQACFEQVLSQPRKPIPTQWRRRNKDGQWRWLEGIGTNLLDEPAVKAVVTNYRDITERKQAEDQIISLNRVYVALSNCNQAIVRIRDKNQLLDEICRIAVQDGQFPGAWIGFVDAAGQTLRPAAAHGSIRQIELDAEVALDGPLAEVIETGESWICQGPAAGASADQAFASAAVFPLKVFDRMTGVFCFYALENHRFNAQEIRLLAELALDVSFALGVFDREAQRILAQTALKESEERYRAFFDEDLTGAFIATAAGQILECNPAFLKMFGFSSREQAQETNLAALFPSARADQYFRDRLSQSRKLEYHELELRRCDGQPLFAVTNMIGSFDGAGRLSAIKGYIFDDTQRKQLEEQFVQAQKMESLGTLASGIAHDFNNILSIVLGYASLLEEFKDDPENLHDSVEAITQATQRGAGLVRQLLTFARKTSVDMKPMRLNEQIHEFSKILLQTFPKTVTLTTHLAPGLPAVMADVNQMHQVLLNLCLNARDAMPDGGQLTLATSLLPGAKLQVRRPEADGGEYVVLRVEDEGYGMDETSCGRIFEPFYTTKEPGKGTGLGLATVYGILQTHKAFVEVASQPGQGTVFELFFPACTDPNEHLAQAAAAPSRRQASQETILLVEDELALSALLRAVLERRGYQVCLAQDGQEAVDFYLENAGRIALVICDLGLPKLNGKDVFARLKAFNPQLKFILVSGYIEPQIRAELNTLGIEQVLAKPYSPRELVAIVQEMLAQA
ncbi:MAG: PAS domain S-box protein [Candidatus Sericytochromatia bacterium]